MVVANGERCSIVNGYMNHQPCSRGYEASTGLSSSGFNVQLHGHRETNHSREHNNYLGHMTHSRIIPLTINFHNCEWFSTTIAHL